MKAKLLLLTLLLTLPATSPAQGVGGFFKKVGAFVDTLSVKGLDPDFIVAPKKPWQIILQSNINQSDVKLKAVLDGKAMFDETWGDINWEPRIKTDVESYVGIWGGYRGYGFGYSKKIGRGGGSILKFGAVGGSYGLNFRIHSFHTDEPVLHLSGYAPEWTDLTETYELFTPIRVRLLTFDGYYLFNGKRFSYAAAYDQSVIQKRSAGSFMAGAMYYHSTIAYEKGYNADFIMYMNDIGKLKQYQVSIGGGYAYNLVPCKGLLISGAAMLMITAYNRLDVWCYDSYLRQEAIKQRHNPESAEEAYDFSNLSDEEIIALVKQYYSVWPMEGNEKFTQKSRMIPIINARLALTYNYKNWFFSANTQVHNFRFKHGSNKGSLTDWYLNASVGIRL